MWTSWVQLRASSVLSLWSPSEKSAECTWDFHHARWGADCCLFLSPGCTPTRLGCSHLWLQRKQTRESPGAGLMRHWKCRELSTRPESLGCGWEHHRRVGHEGHLWVWNFRDVYFTLFFCRAQNCFIESTLFFYKNKTIFFKKKENNVVVIRNILVLTKNRSG